VLTNGTTLDSQLNVSTFIQREVGIAGNFVPVGDPLQKSALPNYDSWIPLSLSDGTVKPGLILLGVSDKVAYLISPQKSLLDKNNITLNLNTRANITKSEISYPSK